jgi:hypothetical protein
MLAAGCAGVATSADSSGSIGGAGSSGGSAGSPGSSAAGSGSGLPSSGTPGPNCSSKPTRLIATSELAPASVQGISSGMDLAVNATDVYVGVTYSKGGAVFRVPIRGGAATRVAPLSGSETALALTRDYVVVEESDPSEVVRMGLDGSDHKVLFSGSMPGNTIFASSVLATDGQNVYFATEGGVDRVALAGGPPTLLTTHTGAIALVGSNVVVADSSAEALYSVPAVGGSVSTLTGSAGNLGPVLSCGNAVCWASEVPVAPSQEGIETLHRLVPGGTAENIAQSTYLYTVYHLLFDGTDFYGTVMADASPGMLIDLPAIAGAAVQAGGLGSGLAMDSQCLYVGNVVVGVYSVQKSHWNATP